MAHDDLTVRDVLDLIHEHPTAASQIQKLTDVELSFVVYDAFSVHGYYDDYGRGNWGFGVALGGDAVLSSLFGRRLSICGTRDEVRAALDAPLPRGQRPAARAPGSSGAARA